MRRFRLLPLLICLLALALTPRLSNLGAIALVWAADEFSARESTAPRPVQTASAPAPRSETAPPTTAAEHTADRDPIAELRRDAEALQRLAALRDGLERRARAIERRARIAQAAERRLSDEIAEMTALAERLRGLTAAADAAERDRIDRLADIYAGMKPRDAARILNDMAPATLDGLARTVSARALAKIMGEMRPSVAARLTERMAEVPPLPIPRE